MGSCKPMAWRHHAGARLLDIRGLPFVQQTCSCTANTRQRCYTLHKNHFTVQGAGCANTQPWLAVSQEQGKQECCASFIKPYNRASMSPNSMHRTADSFSVMSGQHLAVQHTLRPMGSVLLLY